MSKCGSQVQSARLAVPAVVGLWLPFKRHIASQRSCQPYSLDMAPAFIIAPMIDQARHMRGLTLIELVVTVAISGILLAVAVPSYTNIVATNRLSTAANAIVQSLQEARMAAIKRNLSTQFCSNTAATNDSTTVLGSACGTQGGAAYVLSDDGTTADKIQEAMAAAPGITLSSAQAVIYGGQGLAQAVGDSTPYTGLIADVYTDSISTDNHRCIYMTTGSTLSSCTHTNAGAGCPANEPTDCQQ